MPVVAHGIDVVEVARIERLLAAHEERFLARCFTAAEIDYARGRKRRAEHLAVRFAAKEAVLKALGTGLAAGISWTDVEITRDAAGRPGVSLSRAALARAVSLGISGWLVSLSHTDSIAAASVIAMG